MSNEPPIGRPYSQLYTERGVATEDSRRFRARVGNYIRHLDLERRRKIATLLREEIGAKANADVLGVFLEECTLRDLLDSITHVTSSLWGGTNRGSEAANDWLNFVSRALKEENLGYRLDARGGVHPAVDEEFDAQRRTTIAGLEGPRYVAVLDFYERSIDSLKPPYDTRDAVRNCFEAVENLAKLMAPIARLTPNEVEKQTKPLVLAALTGSERNAANLMLNGLGDWVAACQQYRHAAGQTEPDAPSIELALWMVSDGAAHLRWLASADKKLLATSSATA
jgi:hypothetical protein